jgi:xylose isomerase
MTQKIINHNGVETEFIDNGDDLVIKKTQDITQLVDANKEEYNDSNGKWSDNSFGNKVARIPLAIFDELEKQGITRGFTVIDMPRFKAWLNNPDNRVFRTKAGRI